MADAQPWRWEGTPGNGYVLVAVDYCQNRFVSDFYRLEWKLNRAFVNGQDPTIRCYWFNNTWTTLERKGRKAGVTLLEPRWTVEVVQESLVGLFCSNTAFRFTARLRDAPALYVQPYANSNWTFPEEAWPIGPPVRFDGSEDRSCCY